MRKVASLLLALAVSFECVAAGDPAMNAFMVKTVQPNADPILYISRTPPENDAQWAELLKHANALADATKKLGAAPLARDQGEWLKATKALSDAVVIAIAAIGKKDEARLEDLNEQLYNACEGCHEKYKPPAQ
jgi:cytochrome c556